MNHHVDQIQGKRITVIGAGRSGMAAAKLLKRNGADVFLSEEAPLEEKISESRNLSEWNIPDEFGGHSSRVFQADFLVVSPGMDISSPVLREAREKKIPIFGELEIASWFCHATIIAITGSNGKSTVTTLLGEIFRKVKKPLIVAGNIGQPFSDFVEETTSDHIVVLEVSSFQLETIRYFHPKISVILNITEDHLDRHGSMECYGQIKSRIFENQTAEDYFVYNGRDLKTVDLSHFSRCRKVVFGVDDRSVDCGFIREGALILRMDMREEKIIPIQELKIQGDHNMDNALAVALVARLMSVEPLVIQEVFKTFQGLPHRMEFIREVDGIKWVNDSKATNIFSVWYALGSYSDPVVLIAGGRDKHSDFNFLRKRIQEKTRGLVLIGEAADKMEQAFRGLKPLVKAESLEEAVVQARNMAKTGDVVLLSPACASFDMFKNFEDRGEQFKKYVNQI